MEPTAKILRLGHAPRVPARVKGRHHRWIQRPRMVGADEQRPGAGNVFDSGDLENAHKVDVDHRPHEPTQERINHFARSAMRFRVLSTTWPTSRSPASIPIASTAG